MSLTMRLCGASYNIPQSYPIFQVVIEKLLILFCKYLYFSGCCSSLLWGKGKREPEMVLAPVARGSFFFRSNGFALRAGQRQGGVFRIPPPYLWTPLSPQRVKGCSPLTIPKK